ncbi:class I SAM-dependent methyltransferase [Bradyrhizobium sp. WD16]|uniref:class I SAM-dependent methyltransferase n=1 Tax=Bradyrhizobium sp. WD16 TaxID=1521768 RepID=UPI0020A47023|nr:class I SAM-dependent methyltransferase [Bradyrhizobium sp. WD16]UTD30504.1 NarL family transcriptional regulator [Bradyrhizobium sp. WD16]
MTVTVTRRQTCRLCNSRNVERVVELAPIPLSENYSLDRTQAANAPRFPVDVYMCADCGHVQQLDVIDAKILWDSYTYYSGSAKGMPEHFRQVADKAILTAKPPAGGLVIDIGSNDGSLLKPFKEAGYRVLGVDPAVDAAQRANDAGIPTITSLMTRDLARQIREEHGPAHIICAFNVFAHADDLGEMADCVRIMLAPGGLFFFEAQYLLDIVDGLLIATLFHEHLSHHSVKPLVRFLDSHGLELIAAERAPIQHGSLIGTVQLKGAQRPVENSVRQLLALEAERRLDKLDTLRAFDTKVKLLRERTSELVAKWKAEGATVAGYGAARSGPTLIIQLGLSGSIDFIVDDHPQKVGKFASGDGTLVLPTSELMSRMPDYTVILAWVHSKKIIESNQDYLAKGGRFVVLCPETRVVGKDGDIKI